jgi:hypothetical protein
MADIQIRNPGCEDDGEGGERGERGERGESGERGHRGHRGERGHEGHDGATGATGPTGPSASPVAHDETLLGAGTPASLLSALPVKFNPARTLFVAESWPTGADPTVYFTSIAAAYAASVALNPTAANPVEILVYPGTYPDPITVVSNVHLVGTGQQRAVVVTGAVTWTPSAGVNLPQAGTEEDLNVAFFTFTGPWLVDSTAAPGGTASFVFRGVILRGLTYNADASLNDAALIFASVLMGGAPYTFNNIGEMNFLASRTRALAFTGGTFFNIAGGTELGPVTLSDTASGTISGITDFGPVNVGTGCSVTIAGCNITSPVTVAAGGSADVRGSNFNGDANLVGPGTINRTTLTTSFGPTAVGANPVVFAVSYPDGTYNVNLQLTAGPGSAGVTVTAKTGVGFTINDPVGGNTFDVIVIHD